ncbi:MAG: hypothetical protein IKN30_04985, partial [Synergistaceae bacterium]|nr:hypothetical protein [Synergistaceae bacterium]
LRALFAKWTVPYYKDAGWDIAPLELPTFKVRPTRYQRPGPELLGKVKRWYSRLDGEMWFAATMMLEFAMRNGDVLRLTDDSFVEKGGQNPFEPALFGLPAIHGPCMTDFPDTERMDAMGAAMRVSNDTELANAWEERLEAGAAGEALRDCDEYFRTLGGAAKKTWNEIEEELGIRG